MGVPTPKLHRKIQTRKVPLLMETTESNSESEHVINIPTTTTEASSSSSPLSRPVNGSNSRQNEDLPSTNPQLQHSFSTTNSRNMSFARRGNGNGNGRRRSPLNSGYWISVELVITVIQIVAAIVVLSLSRDEHPRAPLFTWVIGYASGCVVTLPLLLWRFHNRNSNQELSQTRQNSTPGSLSAIASSFTSSSNGRILEGDNRNNGGTSTRRLTMGALSARMKVLVEYFEMGLDCFFAVWFVVGNVWIFGGHSSSSEAPNLYSGGELIQGLAVKEMEELHEDIKMHPDLDRATPTHIQYWEALLVVCEWELAEARKKDTLDRARVRCEQLPPELLAEERGLHSSIEADVKKLLDGKSFVALEALQLQIESQMRSGTAKVVEYCI